MKKITMMMAAVVSITLIQSCNSNSENEMKKPISGSIAAKGEKKESDEELAEKKADVNNASENAATKALEATTLNFQNLQDAFKGETTASAKYAAFSKKAEAEGFHQIALLFKAASISENIHANNHKAVLEEGGQTVPKINPDFKVNTTAENLKEAIAGEGYEISTMYPDFIRNANTAENQLSLVSLNYAYKTEKKHKVLYEKALAALENNAVASLPSVYYICPTCGNTYETTAPKRCGISMTWGDKFIKISNLNS